MLESASATQVADENSAADSQAVRRRRVRLRRSDPPFLRNAYALVLNTGISGVLGLVYWILAARYYDDSDVGRGPRQLENSERDCDRREICPEERNRSRRGEQAEVPLAQRP